MAAGAKKQPTLIKQANPPAWREIPGFEGAYEVSEDGQVRRIGRSRGAVVGRVLKAQLINSGYLLVMLWTGNQQSPRLVHRLVAAAFIGPCHDGLEVNHKDFSKVNNAWTNLEYVTRSGNLKHRAVAGIGRGAENGSAKLTEPDVHQIRRGYRGGEGYKTLGRRFGVSWEAVRNIIKKRAWGWVAE